jgi:hypothetical protein
MTADEFYYLHFHSKTGGRGMRNMLMELKKCGLWRGKFYGSSKYYSYTYLQLQFTFPTISAAKPKELTCSVQTALLFDCTIAV